MTIGPPVRQRRHTRLFLRGLRAQSPVHLDTDVEMHAVLADRQAAKDRGERRSIVTYILSVAARTIASHPDANAAVGGVLRPRLARYSDVAGKLTFDKYLGGQRVVLSAVLPGLDGRSLAEIQADVDRLRDSDPEHVPEFAGVRALQRLPAPVGWAAYRLTTRPLARRPGTTGTFAVTSLGHRAVDGFHSLGGTTVTLGVGRIADRPVVRDGSVVIAPVLRLNLTFDHRVIDGAEAADVLTEIKTGLETFSGAGPADRRNED